MKSRRLLLPLVVAAGLWVQAAVADVVVFKTGRRLQCKVTPPQEGDETLHVVLNERGSMVLRLETVDHIEYDYDSMLAALTDEDYLGHYRLGVWCIERDLYDKALERLSYARGKEDVPPEADVHLATAYEFLERPNWREALKHILEYLDKNPAGALRQKAEAARQRLEAEIEKRGLDDAPEEVAGSLDGLEASRWSTPGWGNHAALNQPRKEGAGRDLVLQVEYLETDARGTRNPPDKAKAPVQLALTQGDLTETPILSLCVYNPDERPVKFSIAFATGQSYDWHESKVFTAPAKEWLRDVRVDATRKIWKSKQSNWRHSSPVQDLNRVRNLILLIYNGNRKGTLFFDRIQFSAE